MRMVKFVMATLVLVVTLMLGQGARAAGQPDLYLESHLYTPFSATMGVETLVIANGGADDAGKFRVFVLNDVTAQVLHVFTVPKLAAGEMVKFNYTKSCRERERVIVDRDNTVAESDEFNNITVIKAPACR